MLAEAYSPHLLVFLFCCGIIIVPELDLVYIFGKLAIGSFYASVIFRIRFVI